jgi:hypothetical protein
MIKADHHNIVRVRQSGKIGQFFKPKYEKPKEVFYMIMELQMGGEIFDYV